MIDKVVQEKFPQCRSTELKIKNFLYLNPHDDKV